jgi:hypothetical protein
VNISGTDEAKVAMAALYERHPDTKNWGPGSGFHGTRPAFHRFSALSVPACPLSLTIKYAPPPRIQTSSSRRLISSRCGSSTTTAARPVSLSPITWHSRCNYPAVTHTNFKLIGPAND